MRQSIHRYLKSIAEFASDVSFDHLPSDEKKDVERLLKIRQKSASLLRFLLFYRDHQRDDVARTIAFALLSRLEILGLNFDEIGNFWPDETNGLKRNEPEPTAHLPAPQAETLPPQA